MKRLIFIVLISSLMACSSQNILSEEREYVKKTIKDHAEIKHHQLLVENNQLHYASHGEINKPALIIIHGTPGNWEQYARYLLNETLLKHYRVIVIDRPGWGRSRLADGQFFTSFAEQARIISALLKKLREESGGQAIVLMGHSLGASLAPRIAMDYPQLIDGLLLFAGTLNPEFTEPRWYNYLAAAPLVKYVIGQNWHRSNKEMFALKGDLNAMQNRWAEIKTEVIAVQGMRDSLVRPANSQFIERTLDRTKTKVYRLEQEGHLFPMTRRAEVVGWALQLLDKIEGADLNRVEAG